MIETKYYCDHCKKEVGNKCDFYRISMALSNELDVINTYSKEICFECTNEALGIDLGIDINDKKYNKQIASEAYLQNFMNIVKRFFSGVKR